jgi:hypothetical protein
MPMVFLATHVLWMMQHMNVCLECLGVWISGNCILLLWGFEWYFQLRQSVWAHYLNFLKPILKNLKCPDMQRPNLYLLWQFWKTVPPTSVTVFWSISFHIWIGELQIPFIKHNLQAHLELFVYHIIFSHTNMGDIAIDEWSTNGLSHSLRWLMIQCIFRNVCSHILLKYSLFCFSLQCPLSTRVVPTVPSLFLYLLPSKV